MILPGDTVRVWISPEWELQACTPGEAYQNIWGAVLSSKQKPRVKPQKYKTDGKMTLIGLPLGPRILGGESLGGRGREGNVSR